MLPKNRPPTHPAVMLRAEFAVDWNEIYELLGRDLRVDDRTATALSIAFGNTREFWLNGQAAWDAWWDLQNERGA